MERFWDKAELRDDGCFLWTAAMRGTGYGCFKLEGKTVDSHRVAYMLTYGEIPERMLICHTCDVRACINPEHLWLGTYLDNALDCIDKGRAIRKKTSALHGTYQKYATGCRCSECRLANATYKRLRYTKEKRHAQWLRTHT